MERKIKISVIIPTYNVEKYLNQALESVVNQELKDFEILIINDGSQDNSLLIAQEFQKKFNNIKIFNQENGGLGYARNKGIEKAKGEYIYFFDSDDVLSKGALEIMYSTAVKNNLDLLLFSGDAFSENESIDLTNFFYKKSFKSEKPINGEKMFRELLDKKEYSSSPCLYLVKKTILTDNNITFYEKILHEDIIFTWAVLLYSNQVMSISNILFHRRVRENSIMTGKNYESKVNSLMFIFKKLIVLSESNEKLKNSDINYSILSDVFGNIIRIYSKLPRIKQRELSGEIEEINSLGMSYKYFGRKDYKLFGFSKFLYVKFRILFDKYIHK